ncbi:MAG: hypothetical protein QE484_06345 [Rhizobium sp.]|nr:hypothetical protein [Rhizobium sp.]
MPNDDLVVTKPENAHSASGILTDLLDGGFAALLDDKDIKHACLKELAEVGCRPPANHVVWFCVRKLASSAEGFLSETLKSKLIDILEASPAIAGVLRRISNLKSAEKDKNTLKQRLLEDLNVSPADDEAMLADMTTELEVVTALHTRSTLQGISGQIADLAKEIGATLETVLRDMTEPRLLTAGVDGNWERSGRIDSVLERLTYTSGLYGFHGREDELAVLSNFLSQIVPSPAMNRFSWLLLTGPGGEGKSRLALEFCKNHVPAPWIAGKLGFEELKALTSGPFNWRPRRPTLFVIDYPAQAPEAVNKLLRMFDRDWKEFDLPVRVLLLERDIKGEWFKQFLGGDSASQGLLDHVLGNMREGYPVPPLAPEAIVTLMKERFEKAGLKPPPDDRLLFAAWKVDFRSYETDKEIIPLPRALFASAVAETLIEAIGQGDVELDAVIEALDRNDIFDDLIERERQTRWRPACAQNSAKLEWHENLLAFATMGLGLPRSALNTPQAKGLRGEVLPLGPDVSVLEAMGSIEPTFFVNAVEPDILGEHFVLSRLESLQKAGLAQELIDAAFELDRGDFLRFCLRCLNDFPDRTRGVGLLSPSETISLVGARLFAGLCIDLIASLSDQADWSELDQLRSRIRSFRDRFSTDPILARREAMAAFNFVTHASMAGDWGRVETMLTRLDAIHVAFPNSAEIALEQSKAAFNVSAHASAAGDWLRVEAMFNRLDAMRADFPDQAEIAQHEAAAAVNVTGHAGAASDWARCEVMLDRLGSIRASFPHHTEIPRHEAMAAFNVLASADAAGDRPRVEAMFNRLDALSAAFPTDGDIAFAQAKSAGIVLCNASAAGDWVRVDAGFKRLDALRTKFPDHSDIGRQEAMAAVNVTSYAGAAGNWVYVEAMVNRLHALWVQIPADAEIVRQCAMAAVNVTIHAGGSGIWTLVEAMHFWVKALVGGFESNSEIASMYGHASARRYYSYRQAGQWPDLDQSADAALGAMARVVWSAENSSTTGFGSCIAVIKDAHVRFPDDKGIEEIFRLVGEIGVDWDQIPNIETR